MLCSKLPVTIKGTQGVDRLAYGRQPQLGFSSGLQRYDRTETQDTVQPSLVPL